jgi:nucleoid DNA-binding protein
MIQIMYQPTIISGAPAFPKDWKTSVVESRTPLSADFTPGESDVICVRGEKAKNHPGNLFFHSMIEKSAPKYATAEGKLGKSLIVSEIIDTIRRKSPPGGFVKHIGSQWYEVGDWSAREKVSQSLRDILHGQYRSSASSKKRRRDEVNAKMSKDLESLIDKNEFVSKRIRTLSDAIKRQGDVVSDAHLKTMMTQVNSDILSQIKMDDTLQEQLQKIGGYNSQKHDSRKGRKPKRKLL